MPTELCQAVLAVTKWNLERPITLLTRRLRIMSTEHQHLELPLSALGPGLHDYSFELDDAFFSAFEDGLLDRGDVTAGVSVERAHGQWNLQIVFDGKVEVECDRCLEPFMLPVDGRADFVIKLGTERPDDPEELIMLPVGTDRYSVAALLYETVSLALPMSRTHDMAGELCSEEMIQYLRGPSETGEAGDKAEPSSDELPSDSPWSVLDTLRQRDN